jgi:hypothetical protein
MQSFVSRHQHQIQGTLSGFDRLRFVGSLLRLSYVDGLAAFLAATGVLLKEFGEAHPAFRGVGVTSSSISAPSNSLPRFRTL